MCIRVFFRVKNREKIKKNQLNAPFNPLTLEPPRAARTVRDRLSRSISLIFMPPCGGIGSHSLESLQPGFFRPRRISRPSVVGS